MPGLPEAGFSGRRTGSLRRPVPDPGSWEDIQNMTLYDLGYPLGAHIEVIQRNGAIDFLDTEKLSKTVFAFDEDHLKMHDIHKL